MATEARSLEAALSSWREHDATRALHAVDRKAIRATDAARELVLDELTRQRTGPRDLFNACAALGRLLADAGASPSLAVTTIDGAVQALASTGLTCDLDLIAAARASVAEGYFAAVMQAERSAARRAWEYPACAARLDDDTVAIVAGYPADDGDSLADWAARTAARISRERVRKVVVSGAETARAELTAALSLVGIAVLTDLRERPWLRLPWR